MPIKQSQQLIDKIKNWNTNLEYFKKLVDRDDCNVLFYLCHMLLFLESQKPKLEKTMENINQLSIQIKRIFDQSNTWPHADKVKAKKFQKDFMNKMDVYTNLLTDYRDKKSTELTQFRTTYTARRQTIQKQKKSKNTSKKPNKYEQQQQQQGVQIQLQQVNQQTLFQQHMIQLKQKQLLQVKNKMQQALKVQKQMSKLVNAQGQVIDQIQVNVDSARSNVKEAGTLLEEGVEHHRSATRKKMIIIGIIFIALLVIIIPILIKFL